MKILSKEVKEVVYKKMRTLEGIKCSCCEKIIKADTTYHTRPQRRYFRVTTGHHDWGTDSCESIEYHDICPECIGSYVTEYLDDANTTQYIEIETRYVYPELINDRDED